MKSFSEFAINALNIECLSLAFSDDNGCPIDAYEQFGLSSPLLYTLIEEAPTLFNLTTPYKTLAFVSELLKKGSMWVEIEPSMGCKIKVGIEIAQVQLHDSEDWVDVTI